MWNVTGAPFASQHPIVAVTIDLIEGCNLVCEYCFTGNKPHRPITLDQCKATIDWLLSKETSGQDDVEVFFFGGEPMLMFDPIIKPAVEYGRETAKLHGKKISFGMTTNGTLMTEDACQFFKENDIGILLSWDGDQPSHDRYRVYADGTGSHADILANAPHILRHLPNTTARITLSKENTPNLFHDVRYLWELGFKSIAVTAVQEYEWSPEDIVILEQQYDLISDWYIEHWRAGESPYIKTIHDYASYILNPTHKKHPCGAGRTYLGVTVDGYVFPCHRFHNMGDETPHEQQYWAIGNIADGLHNSERRDEFLKFPERISDKCKACRFFVAGTCWGNCYAVNMATSEGHKSIMSAPDISCVLVELGFKAGLRVLKALKDNNHFLRAVGGLVDGGEGPCSAGDTCKLCHVFSNAAENRGEPNEAHREYAVELLAALRRNLDVRLDIAESIAQGEVLRLPSLQTQRQRDGGRPDTRLMALERKVDLILSVLTEMQRNQQTVNTKLDDIADIMACLAELQAEDMGVCHVDTR